MIEYNCKICGEHYSQGRNLVIDSMGNKLHFQCAVMREIKLLKKDYVNTHTDIDIIKKYLNNIQKTTREILKRVSL